MTAIKEVFDTPAAINARTQKAQLYIKARVKRAKQFQEDPQKATRLKELECAYCFYSGQDRIVGWGFTKYNCKVCGDEHQESNTAVPALCTSCATTLNVCRRCGADLQYKTRK